MRSLGHGVTLLYQLLRHEGGRAFADRLRDRWAERQARRGFERTPRPAGPQAGTPRWHAPVLNLAPTAPAPRLGGVEAQLCARRDAEAEERHFALLYPWAGRWRLELTTGNGKRAFDLGKASELSPLAPDNAALRTALERATAIVRPRAIHAETLHRLPWRDLLAIRDRGLQLVFTVHDFTLFCPRPQLLEEPGMVFCGYCRDLERCRRCLAARWQVADDAQHRRRELAGELLRAASAVVYPSAFLRARHRALFPECSVGRHEVISPGTGTDPPSSSRPEAIGPLRRVAFIGGGAIHKGAHVFAEIVGALGAAGAGRPQWSVYGGGGLPALRALRRLPEIRVHGYYRYGSLPERLRQDRIQLVLLLSIWPETFSLVLSECQLAGVPVLALGSGALAQRIAEEEGFVVAPEAGADGVAELLGELLRGERAMPDRPSSAEIPTAAGAARAHLDLYRDLDAL